MRTFRPCLVVLLVLAAWTAGTPSAGAQEQAAVPPEEAESREQFVRGKELFAGGWIDEAREAFTRSRDLAPDNAGPHLWLGFVEEKRGDCAAAMASFDAFLAR